MAEKLFYSMGEVAEMFDVNPSLLRYWEEQFPALKPKRNRKGNRHYTPEDVELLKQIYHLVKERGMRLEGARKAMKGSTRAIPRDTELLERLQRIRSALVEVREELKMGDDEQVVSSENAAWEEAENSNSSRQKRTGKAVTIIESAEEDAKSETKPKRRVARRKKAEEEKELFPFYEQSLF